MDTYIIASLLLAARLVSAALFLLVIIKQVRQIRYTATEYPALRMLLAILTVVLFVGQFVPIYFAGVFAIGEWGQSETPDPLVIAYTATNALTYFIGSIVLFVIYYRHAE